MSQHRDRRHQQSSQARHTRCHLFPNKILLTLGPFSVPDWCHIVVFRKAYIRRLISHREMPWNDCARPRHFVLSLRPVLHRMLACTAHAATPVADSIHPGSATICRARYAQALALRLACTDWAASLESFGFPRPHFPA